MKKIALLLGFAALVGCDDEEAAGNVVDASVRDGFVSRDQGIRDQGVAPECVEDTDCDAGEVCTAGACVGEAPECVGNEDCMVGQVCEGGACVPEELPDCAGDDDCDAGETCEAGTCVPDEGPECVDDTDCTFSQACQGGTCVDVECRDDGNCDPGETCENNRCVETPECARDADCGADEVCEAGACVDAPECVNDGDCGPGEVCRNATCIEDVPPPECRGNADCAPGEICVAGTCEDAPPPPECQGHADCLPGQLCINGVCEDNVGPDCVDDADCALGELCVDGLCQPGQPGDCGNAAALNGFGQVQGTTAGAANGFAGGCGGDAAPEAIFRFAPDAAGEICVDTQGSEIDTVVYVRAGDCVAGAEIGCNDDDPNDPDFGLYSAVTINVVDDAPLFIFVDGFDGEEGAFVLNVNPGPCAEAPACADDADCGLGEVCVDGVCQPDQPADCMDDLDCAIGEICVAGACEPAGPADCVEDADCPEGQLCVDGVCAGPAGTCEDPNLIEVLGALQGATAGANNFGASCGGGAGGPEAIYAFAVDGPGTLCLNTNGSGFDTVLHVRAGDCLDEAAELACDDDSGDGNASQIELAVEADVAYYVFVDGFAGAAGDFVLNVDAGPCPVPCFDDLDCNAGEACVEGLCEPLPPECAADADCAEGEICDAGQCVALVPGTCQSPLLPEAFGDYPGSSADSPANEVGSCGGNGSEVAYAFVVDQAGPICLSTVGSAYDTVLYVRAGDCDPASEVACNDDPAEGTRAELTLEAEADVVYTVFVDSFFAGGGDYVFSINPGPCGAPPACAVDADCAEGEVCNAGVCEPAVVGDGTCANPLPIAAFGPVEGTTVGAPADQTGTCGGRGNEVVYAFAVDGAGEVCLSTAGSGYDTVLHVRQGDCADAATEVACNDDAGGGLQSEITLAVEADVPYFVFVDGFGGAGNYTFTITPGPCGAEPPPACEADADCAEGEICDAGACVPAPVANGTCDAPNPILQVGALNGATAGVSAQAGSCGGGGAPEAVYVFSVDGATPVCVDTVGSAFDTILYVRTACGDAASEVGCNDDAVGLQSRVQVAAEPGVDYFVFVDGFGARQGNYTLNLNIGPCP